MTGRLVLTAILVFATGTLGRRINVHIPDPGSTRSQPNCRYEFLVPQNLEKCSHANDEVSEHIDKVRADFERNLRLHASQNAIIQDQINNAEKTSEGYDSHMEDLRNALRQIKNHLSNGSPASGSHGKDTRRMLQQTTYSFKKVLNDIENKMVQIYKTFQKDAIAQSKLNAALEMQVRIQDQKSTKAEEQVKDLATAVNDLKNKSSGTSGNAGVTAMGKVQHKIKQFEEEINKYDRMQQQQIANLQDNGKKTFLQNSNNSYNLRNAGTIYVNLLIQFTSTEQHTAEISANIARLQSASESKLDLLDKVLDNVKTATGTLRNEIQSVAANVMNSTVTVNQDKKKILHISDSIDVVSTKVTNILKNVEKQTSATDRVSRELSSLSTTLNPAQVLLVNKVIRNLQHSASIGSELHHVKVELSNLKAILAGLKKPPSTVFKTSAMPSGSTFTTGSATATSSAAPGPTSTSHTSIKTPPGQGHGMSTTSKTTFKIPTFAPIGTSTHKVGFNVPTLSHMSSSSTAFKVPTFAPIGTSTTKVGFKLPPTPVPISSSSKTMLKIPTVAPTTSMRIPTLTHVPSSGSKITFRIPTLTTPVVSSTSKTTFKVPTFPQLGTPTAKVSFNIPTLAPRPSQTTKLAAPTFRPIKVPTTPFRIPPLPAKMSTSGALVVPPLPTPVPPRVLGPNFQAGKK